MSDDAVTGCVAVVLAAFVCLGALAVHGCKSSNQAAVYQREGIQISTWEVFWGAKPAERVINLK